MKAVPYPLISLRKSPMGSGGICVLADELFCGQAGVMGLIYRWIGGLVDSAVAEALMAFWERSQSG